MEVENQHWRLSCDLCTCTMTCVRLHSCTRAPTHTHTPYTDTKEQNTLREPGMVTHTCNLRTWEVEIGRSWVQSCPQLHSEFKASLGYLKPCLKTKQHQIDKQTEEFSQCLEIINCPNDNEVSMFYMSKEVFFMQKQQNYVGDYWGRKPKRTF